MSAWGLDIQPLPGLDLDVLPAKTESVAVESSFLGPSHRRKRDLGMFSREHFFNSS